MSLVVNKIEVPQLFLLPTGSEFFFQFISVTTPVKYMYQWNSKMAERRITQVSTYIDKVASYAF